MTNSADTIKVTIECGGIVRKFTGYPIDTCDIHRNDWIIDVKEQKYKVIQDAEIVTVDSD